MVYLTYNDAASGIYSSQVIDVCNYLNERLSAKIRLVAFISLRGFSNNRRKIKSELPSAIVLPMFPGIQNWSLNAITLFFVLLFIGRQGVIARGPFAANIAIALKQFKLISKVCFDARGAYDAEFNEYKVAGINNLNSKIYSIEKDALLNSDYQLAVSNKLVDYWKRKFEYNRPNHVVIPCTIHSQFGNARIANELLNQRKALGFLQEDILVVYSGSSAGWQSLNLADDFLCKQMRENSKVKALLLIDKVPENLKVLKDYGGRVAVKWFGKNQIQSVLGVCDYGLLLREASVTNQVSSPVKFAEYLATGLQIVISKGVGDYTDFVKANNVGMILEEETISMRLNPVSIAKKEQTISIANGYFLKSKYANEYQKILSALK